MITENYYENIHNKIKPDNEGLRKGTKRSKVEGPLELLESPGGRTVFLLVDLTVQTK